MKCLLDVLKVAYDGLGVTLMLLSFAGLGIIIAVQLLDMIRRALFP